MKLNKKLITAAILSLVLMAGCSAGATYQPAPSTTAARNWGMTDQAAGSISKESASIMPVPPYDSGDKTNALTVDRKLVKKGDISLNVTSIDDFKNKVNELAGKYKGYVYSSNLNESTGYRYLNITIKVSSENFDAALNELGTFGRVQSTSMNVMDVTTQFMDLEARLKTLKVKEQTLTSLLAKAEKIEDILNIENNLQYTRQEIEFNEGQLNVLKNSSDYSEIYISANDNKGLDTTQPQNPIERFMKSLGDGLRYWGNAVINLVDSAIFLLPVLIPALIILSFLGIRHSKKVRERRAELKSKAADKPLNKEDKTE